MKVLCVALVLDFGSGCSRVTLVNEGSPMRVGPACNTTVYTMTDGAWVLSPNKVSIPEGWYILPPSFANEKEQ